MTEAHAPVLYYAARSSALAPRLVLELAGATYRLHHIDLQQGEQRGADFLSRNALGRVPVLEEGTFVLTENVAILTYLGRRYPDAGLMPAAARDEARCIEWLAWGASALHPAMAHVRRPERYAVGRAARRDVAETAGQTLADLFAITEERLVGGDWAAGTAMSVADLYLLFFWLWGPRMGPSAGDLPHCPVWSGMARRLLAQTVIARIVREEGLFPDGAGAT